jgi:hypothetical protein
MLHDAYRKNWEPVVGVKDDLKRLNKALDWVAQYPRCEEIQGFARVYMFTLIMRSYRGHAFTLLKDKVRKEFQKEARSGQIALCQTELRRVLVGEQWESISIIGARKATKIQDLKHLVDFLFDYDDGQKRGRSWEGLAFRYLYQEMSTRLLDHYSPAMVERTKDIFKRHFISNNFLIPYPTPTKFVQTDHYQCQLWIGWYHYKLINQQRRNAVGAQLSQKLLVQTIEDHPTYCIPARREYPQDNIHYIYGQRVYNSPEDFEDWVKLWSFGRPIDLKSYRYLGFTGEIDLRFEEEEFIKDYNRLSREDPAAVERWFNSLPKTHKQVTEVFQQVQPGKYRWLRDWDLRRDKQQPLMGVVPVWYSSEYLEYGVDLQKIQDYLEETYAEWQRLERDASE